jgi:hypothetical protein
MKKTTLLLILSVLVSSFVFAEKWNTSVDVSLSMNQNSYSDNWSGDEKGTINWVFNANLLAEKPLSSKVYNTNTMKLAFGQTHNQFVDENGEKDWASPEKTTDQIDFLSMLRFTLGTIVDPFVGFRFESQFMDKSVPNETKIINPITLTGSFGVARVFLKKENTELTSQLGGAFKEYLNSHKLIDNKNDGGIEFITNFRTPLAKGKISFNSMLDIYKAFFFSESDETENDDWKAPRLNWENIFSASITKLINVNLYIQMIYDKPVVDEMQFKQTLALGLTYKLM